jgi:hypothetical protein
LQPNPVERGGTVTVSVEGWRCPDAPVTLRLYYEQGGSDVEFWLLDDLDSTSFEFSFPAPELPGDYVLYIRTAVGECTFGWEEPFVVIASTPVPSTLPPSTAAPTTAAVPGTTTTAVGVLPPTGGVGPTGGLPPTGTSSTGPLVLVAMLLAGVGLVLVTRSRSVSQV